MNFFGECFLDFPDFLTAQTPPLINLTQDTMEKILRFQENISVCISLGGGYAASIVILIASEVVMVLSSLTDICLAIF